MILCIYFLRMFLLIYEFILFYFYSFMNLFIYLLLLAVLFISH